MKWHILEIYIDLCWKLNYIWEREMCNPSDGSGIYILHIHTVFIYFFIQD